jgi:hypothetical protein
MADENFPTLKPAFTLLVSRLCFRHVLFGVLLENNMRKIKKRAFELQQAVVFIVCRPLSFLRLFIRL